MRALTSPFHQEIDGSIRPPADQIRYRMAQSSVLETRSGADALAPQSVLFFRAIGPVAAAQQQLLSDGLGRYSE